MLEKYFLIFLFFKLRVISGYGRCLVYKHAKATARKYPNQTFDRLMGPTVEAATRKPIYKHQVLDQEGIVYVGARIHSKQVSVSLDFNAFECKLSLLLIVANQDFDCA